MAECKVWPGRASSNITLAKVCPSSLSSDTKTAQEQLSTKAKLREETGVRAGVREGGGAGVNANLNDAKTVAVVMSLREDI